MIFSHIWGSFNASFNSTNIFFPLLGSFIGNPVSIVILGLFFGVRSMFLASPITMGIPTFFATLNWSVDARSTSWTQFIIQVTIPLTCMALFILNPVGSHAWFYSLYWLIPVALYGGKKLGYHSVFSTALSSTFIAHALGSIMWLYTTNIGAPIWIALIPRVAVERSVFAAGSTLTYHGLRAMLSILKTYRNKSRFFTLLLK